MQDACDFNAACHAIEDDIVADVEATQSRKKFFTALAEFRKCRDRFRNAIADRPNQTPRCQWFVASDIGLDLD
jgi:hypothetical protein